MELEKEARKQIAFIEVKVIIDFLLNMIAETEFVRNKDLDKIQKMFNIVNDNDINYGIEETDSN